jgi:hypothetical protein
LSFLVSSPAGRIIEASGNDGTWRSYAQQFPACIGGHGTEP